MQKVLAEEIIAVEKGGIKVVMDGNMEVKEISINENLAKDSLEGIMADCINDAIKKTQRIMARKMQDMGGLPKFN